MPAISPKKPIQTHTRTGEGRDLGAVRADMAGDLDVIRKGQLAPNTAGDAARAERAATVDLAKAMQTAPTLGEANALKRAADDARMRYAPPGGSK